MNGVMLGPLHKIQGYQGHQNVSKCRPHHSGDIIMYNKGKQFENQFFIYGPKCKQEACRLDSSAI